MPAQPSNSLSPSVSQIPSDASPTERWWREVRSQTFKQLPLESALSWPVPVVENHTLRLDAFYFGVQRVAGPGTSRARPPLARLSASFPSARLLLFIRREYTELFPGLPMSGDLGLLSNGDMQPAERMQARSELFSLYTEILNQYPQDSDVQARQAFASAFWRLAEPGLLPYYHALNPHFFEWLSRNIGG